MTAKPDWTARLFRALIRLLPFDFRSDYGRQIEQVFDDQRRDLSHAPLRVRARLSARAVGGLLSTALVEHMAVLTGDARLGVRTIRKAPAFALVLIVTLAIGIGANTAIFSAIEALLLRPLPYPDADRIVAVSLQDSPTPPETYAAIRDRTTTIEDLAGWSGWTFTVTGDGEAERIRGARVTPSLLRLLGGVPVLGRTFLEEETRPWPGTANAGGSAAMLSHGYWERRYGGDPSVVGRTMTVDGMDVPIVGVLPESFAFPNPDVELWLPVAISPSTPPAPGGYLRLIGRLQEHATPESARADVRSIARQFHTDYPDRFPEQYGNEAALVPLRDDMIGPTRSRLLLLFGAVGAVLLIGCANVANLLLARATGRGSEMAIRAALGAGRRRLVRQVMTEHMVLVGVGALLGLALAHWGAQLLSASLPPGVTGGAHVGLNGRVLAFSIGLTILVGVLSGIAPAARTADGDPQGVLRDAGRGGGISRDRRRLLDALVVSEVAIALVLLVGAGLMLQSFWRLSRQDPGFRAENVLTFRASVPDAAYSLDRTGQFTNALLDRLAALPGARTVGAVHLLPLGGSNWVGSLSVEGRSLPPGVRGPAAYWRVATPDYFRTIGIPLLAGRAFSDDDRAGTPPVALIGQTLARELFPGEDPIGRQVRTDFEGDNWATIVGVVGDTKDVDLGGTRFPQIYRPFAQFRLGAMTYAIRTDGEPLALARAARAAVAEIDPNVPVGEVQPLEAVLTRSIAQPRLLMLLLAAFGVVSLLMAILGIYGVISYDVGQRTREFGIRLALGARPADVSRQVVGGGARLAAIGLFIGLGGAWLLTRFLEGELYESRTHDPLTLAAMAMLLGGAALLGSYLPARRAASVDPMASLVEG
jgi:putative ABC transport system permease protein